MIIYKEIPGFPNYYAGSDGEIYSRNYKKNHIPNEYRKLKPGRQRLNYKVVALKINGKYLTQRLHVLICISFHGARPKGMQCSHLDDNKENNQPENLKWETDSENKQRKFKNGLGDSGFKNSRASLTKEQFKEVKEMLSTGKLHKDIAEKFKCSRTVITRINNGTRYARCSL